MAGADVVRRWADALNEHDVTAFAEVYAPNATVRDPQFPEPLEGRDAIRQDLESFLRAFPDLQLRVRSVVEAGSALAFEVTFAGTNSGPLTTDSGEVPPTGRRVEVDGAAFNRLDGQGRILEQHRYYDLAAMFAQLQLAP